MDKIENTEQEEKKNETIEQVDTNEKDDIFETSVDPDDEKRTGIRDIAQNPDDIAAAKINSEIVKSEKKDVKPSFFIKRSARHIVKLDILTSKEDGRIVSVAKNGLGIDYEEDFPFMNHTKLEFEFSIPNYEDMSTYRQRSSVYRREAQGMIVDRLQLRNFLLVWHLKRWNLTDDEGKEIELSFDPNGNLSEESMSIVYAVSPTLMDVVMTTYEKEVLLG